MEGVRLGSHVLQPDRQLLADGERVHLGYRALSILSVLARAKGEIVTKDELLEAAWPDAIVEENTLQVHIAALRKALGPDADRLETIRGVGYRLEVEDEAEDAGPLATGSRRQDEAPSGEGPPISPPPREPEAAPVLPRSSGRRGKMLAAALVAAAILLAGLLSVVGTGRLFTGGEGPQVTVMPLDALAADEEQHALAAGITEQLVNRLRRVEELQVTTGLPGEQNKGKTLRGSVRADANGMRLTARLEDEDGNVLWSQNFDRELTDLLFVQQEIAASVANALNVTLDVGLDSSRFGGTDDPEAYLNYFQGRLNRYNRQEGMPETYLRRAVELDPNYVLAWTELSYFYGLSLYSAQTQSEVEDLLAKQGEAAARALEAGPELWMAQAARGWFELASGDIRSAAERHRRVEELDPGNNPELRNTLANFVQQVGRVRDASEWRRSKELIDPIYRLDTEGFDDLLLNRRYEEIIRLYEDVRETGLEVPPFPTAYVYWAYLLNGNLKEARQFAEEVGMGRPYTQPIQEALGDNAFPDLPREQLAGWAEQRFGAGGRAALAGLAIHAGYLGRPDLAMDYLELAYSRPGIGGYHLLWHPSLSSVRQTERFEDFIERKGFVALWRETGDWGDFCRPVSESEIECI